MQCFMWALRPLRSYVRGWARCGHNGSRQELPRAQSEGASARVCKSDVDLSLIHISEPTRLALI
eukprot:7504335-Alexandrium_andersonii.AAC.1